MEKLTVENKYYFYNGFAKPILVEVEELTLTDNYKGNMTEDLLEEHNEYVNDSDEDYNEMMSSYGIIRNPKLEDLMIMNTSWFSDKKDYTIYLEDFIDNKFDVLDDYEMSDYISSNLIDEDDDYEYEYEDFVWQANEFGYTKNESLGLWIKTKRRGDSLNE